MTDCYRIQELDLGALEPDRPEQLGSKRKFWFRRSSDRQRYLFKYCRERTGEDWAEKIAAELARQLGLPSAQVDLATVDDQRGVMVLEFTGPRSSGAAPGGALIHGNELLYKIDPIYPVQGTYGVRQHTVDAVLDVLEANQVGLPTTFAAPTEITSGTELFAGYLALDALIGNTDRHHENWGVLRTAPFTRGQSRKLVLAPTFDHASSLGRELSDDTRTRRFRRPDGFDIERYAKRAASALYGESSDPHPLSPREAFVRAARRTPDAARFWLQTIASLPEPLFVEIVEAVPPKIMTPDAKSFAIALLAHNRAKLLEASHG